MVMAVILLIPTPTQWVCTQREHHLGYHTAMNPNTVESSLCCAKGRSCSVHHPLAVNAPCAHPSLNFVCRSSFADAPSLGSALQVILVHMRGGLVVHSISQLPPYMRSRCWSLLSCILACLLVHFLQNWPCAASVLHLPASPWQHAWRS